MRHKRLCLLILALISTFFWYCSGADNPFEPPANTTQNVSIISNGFSPKNVTVSPGTTVQWTNDDNKVHTVDSGAPMSPTAEFSSPNLDPGDRFSETFSNPGTFAYYCLLHSETGSVRVQ